MPAVIRGETIDCDNPKLDVFMRDGTGLPIDVAELSFQVFEKVTTPGVPTQIFPVAAGAREPVDLTPCPTGDKLETGRYHASYEVPLSTPIGTHEIRWFTKLTSEAPEQQFAEEFEVLSEASLLPGDFYISVADVRKAGLNSDPPDDATIQASICLWQQVLERATRQWFRPISIDLYLDGTDSDTLHLPVPIISVSELRLNDGDGALETTRYRVYNGTRLPDDRKNPRIKLVDQFNAKRDIFTASLSTNRSRFFKGRQNQFVSGVFGYVEPDGSTPAPIIRAMLKLVIRDVTHPIMPDPMNPIMAPPLTTGAVKEEWTDGHKIKYQLAGGELNPRAPGLSALINDAEVEMIIRLYKAPLAMAAPANPTWS